MQTIKRYFHQRDYLKLETRTLNTASYRLSSLLFCTSFTAAFIHMCLSRQILGICTPSLLLPQWLSTKRIVSNTFKHYHGCIQKYKECSNAQKQCFTCVHVQTCSSFSPLLYAVTYCTISKSISSHEDIIKQCVIGDSNVCTECYPFGSA